MMLTDLSSHSLTQLLGRASQDAALRERLLADPRGVLEATGLELDQGMTLNVVANTATRIHLVLPEPSRWTGGAVTMVSPVSDASSSPSTSAIHSQSNEADDA